MTRKLGGGNAQPVHAVGAADLIGNGGSYELESKNAIPVWVVAQGGRHITGGPARVVYQVTEAEIINGSYSLRGGPALPIINVAAYAVGRKRESAKTAVPIYVVSNESL